MTSKRKTHKERYAAAYYPVVSKEAEALRLGLTLEQLQAHYREQAEIYRIAYEQCNRSSSLRVMGMRGPELWQLYIKFKNLAK